VQPRAGKQVIPSLPLKMVDQKTITIYGWFLLVGVSSSRFFISVPYILVTCLFTHLTFLLRASFSTAN